MQGVVLDNSPSIISKINKHMLLFPFNQMRESEKISVLKDTSFISEPKFYGCRVFISFFNNTCRIFSRKTHAPGLHEELTDRVYIPDNLLNLDYNVIFDGIIVNNSCNKKIDNNYNNIEDNSVTYLLSSEEGLEYQSKTKTLSVVLLDILYKQGKYLLNVPLKMRKKILHKEYDKVTDNYFLRLSPVDRGSKLDYFKECLSTGYSGVVFKNENAYYSNNNYRDKEVAIKLKKDYCCGLNDIDLFISSYSKGILGLSCFFDYGNDNIIQKRVCSVSLPRNVTCDTLIFSDILSDSIIPQTFFGKVIQVSAKRYHNYTFYGVKPNWRRGFRLDKGMSDCILSAKFDCEYLEKLCSM